MKLRLYKVKGTQTREEPACKHSQAMSVLSLTRPASPQGSMFPYDQCSPFCATWPQGQSSCPQEALPELSFAQTFSRG